MLDERNGWYITKGGRIDLTKLETKLLAYFINNKGKTITVHQIANELYGKPAFDKVVQVVFRFNQKLKGHIKIYSTKKVGYKMEYIGD